MIAPDVLCVLGANGSGKGSATGHLGAYDEIHVEVASEILEAEKERNPAVADTIRHYKEVLKQNVPDEIIVNATMERIRRVALHSRAQLLILDGFGRTPGQILAFFEAMKAKWPETRISFAFFLIEFEEAMRRIEARVQEHLRDEKPVRPEDLGQARVDRFNTYMESEPQLIRTVEGRAHTVTTFNMMEHTTLKVAAHLHGMFFGTTVEEVMAQMQHRKKMIA